ncbi:hypothetical protein H2509_00590 [Stappia sp. F7233]|uniref:Uncharacterized protein n=2 Tax=Stappia albiluteola TaxID=2758565 RepID=A0A839A8R8_9HYPH|nr:hypothetical protein [Stappia albiluteola]
MTEFQGQIVALSTRAASHATAAAAAQAELRKRDTIINAQAEEIAALKEEIEGLKGEAKAGKNVFRKD